MVNRRQHEDRALPWRSTPGVRGLPRVKSNGAEPEPIVLFGRGRARGEALGGTGRMDLSVRMNAQVVVPGREAAAAEVGNDEGKPFTLGQRRTRMRSGPGAARAGGRDAADGQSGEGRRQEPSNAV